MTLPFHPTRWYPTKHVAGIIHHTLGNLRYRWRWSRRLCGYVTGHDWERTSIYTMPGKLRALWQNDMPWICLTCGHLTRQDPTWPIWD